MVDIGRGLVSVKLGFEKEKDVYFTDTNQRLTQSDHEL